MNTHLTLREAVKATGLHPNTLRKYADNGRIPCFRVPNGDRRFDVSSIVNARSATVLYGRVSTTKQRSELTRQCGYLREKYPEAEVIEDIGSGLGFKRKGLSAILDRAMRGERLTVIVTHRDRLSRFGFDLIESIIARSGGKIVVLNQISTSPVTELVSDFMAIFAVFSSRLHGLRSHKDGIKVDLSQTDGGTEGDS